MGLPGLFNVHVLARRAILIREAVRGEFPGKFPRQKPEGGRTSEQDASLSGSETRNVDAPKF